MTKQQQTDEVRVELFKLTLQFTRKYQPRYYYQFRGEVYDLAMEFYCEFLTPKGRGDVKESLLDKFNPEITSLAYLVKVSVQRKLIDRSRADRIQLVSIDEMIESYGDVMQKTFNLVDEVEEAPDDAYQTRRLISAFSALDVLTKNNLVSRLYCECSPLVKILKPVFKYINNCPIQQVTDKTVVVFIPSFHKCINFALSDGHPRGGVRLPSLDTTGLTQYHSGFDRDVFEEYHNELLVGSRI